MLLDQSQPQKWQNIIWREWRNCRNQQYAAQLFELVADSRVGWGTRLSYVLLDGIVGLIIGLLIGFLITTDWNILRQLMLASGAVGAGRGFLAAQRLSWREWLTRLAFGLPTETPNRGMILIGLLLLAAGVIFGPVLWLLVIGLFWGMSGLIKWMTKGLLAANAFTYSTWYFWWRRRPSLEEVETALLWAAQVGLSPADIRPTVTDHPLQAGPPLVEIDFGELRAFAHRRKSPRS